MKDADHSWKKAAFIATMGRLRPEKASYGYCFDDYFTLVLTKRYATGSPDVVSVSFKEISRVLLHLLNIVRFRQKKFGLPRILFTLLSSKPHLKSLVERTLCHLSKEECAIFQFSGKSAITSASVIEAPKALLGSARLRDSFPALSDLLKIWRLLGQYDSIIPLGLRVAATTGIWHTHVRASIAYTAYKRLLANSELDVLVVEYDHSAKTVPLVLAANDTGKHTYTFQHGLINSPGGYDPVIADKIFVWGDFFRDTLIAYGVPAEKIIVTGCQSIDEPELSGEPDGVLQLIYASTAYTESEKRILAVGIEKALKQIVEVPYKFAVKAHPSDRLEYKLDKDPPDAVIRQRTIDCLPWCDVLIGHNTTVALDAMRMGKLVLLIDFIETPLSDTMRQLVDEGCCHAVTTPDELAESLVRFKAGDDRLEQVRVQGRLKAKELYAAVGSEAGANAAKAILAAV